MATGKIFCVGFHKTGTLSVSKYFASCGLSVRHWPTRHDGVDYEQQVAAHWMNSQAVLTTLTPVIEAHQVHCDVPWPGLVDDLVMSFPDALFVMTFRDPHRWWESLQAHWSLDHREHVLSPFERIQYRRYLPDVTRKFGTSDRDAFIGAFESHLQHVTSTVPAERLLGVAIDDPGIAGQLSSFTGTDPDIAFPDAERRPHSLIKAIRRLGRARRNRSRFGWG